MKMKSLRPLLMKSGSNFLSTLKLLLEILMEILPKLLGILPSNRNPEEKPLKKDPTPRNQS